MKFVTGLKCTLCGATYMPDQVSYVCPQDGANLDVQYDYEAIGTFIRENGLKPVKGMWRYKALLPIDYEAEEPPLLVGDTPFYRSERVAQKLGVKAVYFKDDGRNPTASLKDRASSLIVAKAHDENKGVVTTASTGNAAAALAGLAASMGVSTVIFVPATAPVAKITQLLVYGAKVMLVNGTYDMAFDLCLEATAEFGWYCRNTGYNPYTSEGKKTVAYEICENYAGEPGMFRSPDVIFVSVGDGNIISGLHKGLKDLLALGWIEKMPRIIGVQAEGSNAMYLAWKNGLDPHTMPSIDAQTVADSISAGLPRDPIKALKAITETGGAYITVTDEEIIAAIPVLARDAGIFAEPAASATYAGMLKAARQALIGEEDEVVGLITGNGLKDITSAQKSVSGADRIEPNIEEVKKLINR